MAEEPIPEDIRRFVLTSVPSVPYLEALLLLRAEAHRGWDANRVAERLYCNAKAAEETLIGLCASGVAARNQEQQDVLYFYQPVSDELRQLVDRLADIYAKNLVEVTHLIHSRLDRKAQQFADAFTWRKDP